MDQLVVDAISVKRSQGDLSVRSDHQSDEDPEASPGWIRQHGLCAALGRHRLPQL